MIISTSAPSFFISRAISRSRSSRPSSRLMFPLLSSSSANVAIFFTTPSSALQSLTALSSQRLYLFLCHAGVFHDHFNFSAVFLHLPSDLSFAFFSAFFPAYVPSSFKLFCQCCHILHHPFVCIAVSDGAVKFFYETVASCDNAVPHISEQRLQCSWCDFFFGCAVQDDCISSLTCNQAPSSVHHY